MPCHRPILSLMVGLAGGSGSGKSWLARRLQRRFPGQIAVLRLDDFYRDLSGLPESRRNRVNFDHPDALDWPFLEACLDSMRRRERCRLPRYDFSTHTRLPTWRLWRPRPLVIIEGLWSLRSSHLRALYDWSLFIQAPESLCLARRLERDGRERGRNRASVLRQFRQHVLPMHRRYVAPQIAHADLVIRPPITRDTLASLGKRIRSLLDGAPEL